MLPFSAFNMIDDELVSFKVYLVGEDYKEQEIRRFSIQASSLNNFFLLGEKIISLFPILTGRMFKLFWKDDDGDNVSVSSTEELFLALTLMKSELKKLYVKIDSSIGGGKYKENKNPSVHFGIFCDQCEINIMGFRYKCLLCTDYDLCCDCEQTGLHAEHPMLRLADPFAFNYINFRKLNRIMSSYFVDSKAHRRRTRESRQPDLCKKKKCDKRESGLETGDESEEGFNPKKHSHKKCKKPKKYSYDSFIDEVLNCLSTSDVQSKQLPNGGIEPTEESLEDPLSESYLHSVGAAIQTFLDPLGVEVQFEVRKKQVDKKKGKAGGASEEKKKEKQPEKKRNPEGAAMKNGIDEITEKLTFQSLKNTHLIPLGKQAENSDESRSKTASAGQSIKEKTKPLIEELGNPPKKMWHHAITAGNINNLKRSEIQISPETEMSQIMTARLNANIPGYPPPIQPILTSMNHNTQTSYLHMIPQFFGHPQERNSKFSYVNSSRGALYPTLTLRIPEHMKDALDKLLAMGFTNEDDQLTHLLLEKDGDIEEALKVLISKQN